MQVKTVELSDDNTESVGENSFVSRLMIWHTAISAYAEHPYIGIGAYSFRHSSQLYYKIPKEFYKEFVKKKTPHVTYLQVLTETGIIGFIGFMIFIYAVIRYSLKTLKVGTSLQATQVKLMIIWSLVYIIFSMMMTESWLYGQYIIWLGILLGMLVNFRKKFEQA